MAKLSQSVAEAELQGDVSMRTDQGSVSLSQGMIKSDPTSTVWTSLIYCVHVGQLAVLSDEDLLYDSVSYLSIIMQYVQCV